MDLLVIVIVGGLLIAAWLFFTKPGKAELALLEARIAALEAKPAQQGAPPPVPGTVTTTTVKTPPAA